jgi:uncharacterized protein (DUF2235 family)
MKFILNLLVTGCLLLSGCTTIYQEENSVEAVEENRDLFIFYDGTANDPSSATNVWKLYQLVKKDNKRSTGTKYIEGVGTKDKPLTGLALGRGMEERILIGYEYLIKNYKSGDNIYIIGFSRGSHQARALAGFISYAGIPILEDPENYNLIKLGNKIIEITKGKNDKDYHNAWLNWKNGDEPPLGREIQNKLGIETQPAGIHFLGVWDTVPGSSFKKFGICREEEDRKSGDRYKSGSYPAIEYIAHAVSIDEKRSKFTPLLACEAIKPGDTKINEVWFPGAHADVGGGYKDETGLSGVSLQWMLDNLTSRYSFRKSVGEVKSDFSGLSHWSIGDRPANIGSKCLDRVLPQNAKIHQSYENRKNAGVASIRIMGELEDELSPLLCSAINSGQE